MEPKSVILRPDWALLDSTFESYKLSLQQPPIYPADLHCQVDTVKIANDEFSYNRTRTISLHNYLFGDPWCESDCYFVDSIGHLKCVSVVIETSIQPPRSVFQLDPHFLQCEKRTPVTISFPSSTLCLICDGAGSMCLLRTGDRQDKKSQDLKWEVVLNEELGNSSNPPILLHSKLHTVDQAAEEGESDNKQKEIINILSLHFEDEKRNDATSTHAFVDWDTVVHTNKDSKYVIESHRTFKGKEAPFYATFGEDVNEVFLGAHCLYSFIPDWNQQLLMDEMEIDNMEDEARGMGEEFRATTTYEWKQTSEEVTVTFCLEQGVIKEHIDYSLKKDEIRVAVGDVEGTVNILLQGKLFAEVDPESSNWTITDNHLEVVLHKQVEDQSWSSVVVGDNKGRRITDEEYQSSNSTEMLEMEARDDPPVGLEQYEHCDDLPDVNSLLYRFDSSTNKFTHEASVASNQWLFNCIQDKKLCTVLRHDVDALVWECNTPTELIPDPWKHVGTFNALGYVRASKEDLKYSGSSPNSSYAALCESNRRVFVYHGPTATKTPLRNRTTGKNIHVSKQQVVTLPTADTIIGFHVTTEHMFVLTEEKLYIIKVTAPEN